MTKTILRKLIFATLLAALLLALPWTSASAQDEDPPEPTPVQHCWTDEAVADEQYCYDADSMKSVPVYALLRTDNVLVPLPNVTIQYRAIHLPRGQGSNSKGVVMSYCSTDQYGQCALTLPEHAIGAFEVPHFEVTQDGTTITPSYDPKGFSTFEDQLAERQAEYPIDDYEYPFLYYLKTANTYYLVFFPPAEDVNNNLYTWVVHNNRPEWGNTVERHPIVNELPAEVQLPNLLIQGVFENGVPISQGVPTPRAPTAAVTLSAFDPNQPQPTATKTASASSDEPSSNGMMFVIIWLVVMALLGGILYIRVINPDIWESLTKPRKQKPQSNQPKK